MDWGRWASNNEKTWKTTKRLAQLKGEGEGLGKKARLNQKWL